MATEGEEARGCYVYGIVRDDARPQLADVTGVADAPVELVRGERLAAIVADVARRDLTAPETEDDGAAWLEAAVRAHEDVLERCLAAGAVLPMRFATTFRAADDVRALLVDEEGRFAATLARLEGRREWGLKAGLDAATATAWLRDARPDLARLENDLASRPPGAAYFERKRLDQEIAAQAEEAVAVALHDAHGRLSAAADDARILPSPAATRGRRERVVLNAAYLVPDAAEQTFHRLVEELRRDHAPLGLRFRSSGPWPPYNFVSDEDADGS